MSLWAIVPIKPLRKGKSRLSPVLSEDERAELSRRMLVATVETLKKVRDINHVLVVSRDPEALAAARGAGARTLLENGNPEINGALTRAALVAGAYKARGVLVMPADLPLLDPDDVREFVARGRETPCVVIAPDRKREGTNALLLAPPDVIPFDYGPGSFRRHQESARIAGVPLKVFEAESISLDLDLPEDLEILGADLRIEVEQEHSV
ncbi:MAG TPA: 2-phospho-L-lactate guanylyltransferase [Anaerolineales bacterium]|nr:2-phospho-L-lactate guanylyltransferase [Anaerolineales bacterium]